MCEHLVDSEDDESSREEEIDGLEGSDEPVEGFGGSGVRHCRCWIDCSCWMGCSFLARHLVSLRSVVLLC